MAFLLRNTRRLTVRPLRRSDFNAWREAHLKARPPQNRWDRKKSESDLNRGKFDALIRSQYEQRKAERFFDLAVFHKSTGELVGQVNVMDVIRGLGQQAFLGYSVLNSHWGKGYGKEAARAAIDIAFRDIRVHRIEAGVERGNIRSIRLARAIGLKKEGYKRGAVFLRGEWISLLVYAAVCEDFGIKWRGKPKSDRKH